MIECRQLSTGYPERTVSGDLTFTVERGSFFSLIGPNGCGKSTLLKTLAGLLPNKGGQLLLKGRNLAEYTGEELARLRSYLPQSHHIPNITVEALVKHGRFPYQGFFRRSAAEDRERVEAAIELTGMSSLRYRELKSLSGGQCQRAYIALAVAQDAELLLWDEATSALDMGARFELYDLAQKLCKAGKTVIMTTQDVAEGLEYSQQVLLLDRQGNPAFLGFCKDITGGEAIERVFGVQSQLVHRTNGSDVLVFSPKK